MSEERKEDDSRKRAAGGSFEQGLKSALEKAPGMVVPSCVEAGLLELQERALLIAVDGAYGRAFDTRLA